MWPRIGKRAAMIAIIAVSLLSLAVAVVIGSWPTAPTPEYISAALREQANAGLEVDYVYEPRETDEGVTRHVARYIRTGEVLSLERKTELRAGGNWQLQSTVLASYDVATREYRVLTTAGDDAGGSVLLDYSPGVMSETLTMESAWLWMVGRAPLFEAVAYGTVGGEPETVDDHECWRVTLDTEGMSDPPIAIVVWLDPAIGFCPRRTEWTYAYDEPRGTIKVTSEFGDYVKADNGAWFPLMRTVTSSEGWSSVVRAQSVKPATDVSKDKLKVAFPPGARVYIGAEKTTITVP